MNSIKRFKITFIALAIWLFCFALYLATTIGGEYAANAESAKSLGSFMSKCSGEIISYGAQGYRCDAFSPSNIASCIILIGIISFIVAIATLTIKPLSKARKH